MLKSINAILKTMGEALAFANTGEMLSEKQKSNVLSTPQKHTSATSTSSCPPKTIACDEDFAIESVDSTIALCRS